MAKNRYGKDTKIVWKDRKRFMGMPLSFTKYILAEKENNWVKLYVSVGFFSTHEEEVNAYRVIDICLKRNFIDKIFGVGTLHLTCKDATTPTLDLKRVKRPYIVRDTLTEIVERERSKKRIRVNEFHSIDSDGDGMHDDFG
mgnify:CR=1 FL=1